MTSNAEKFSGSILEIIISCATNFTWVDVGLRKTVETLIDSRFPFNGNSLSFERPEWDSILRICMAAYINTLESWLLFTGDGYLYVNEDLKR